MKNGSQTDYVMALWKMVVRQTMQWPYEKWSSDRLCNGLMKNGSQTDYAMALCKMVVRQTM